MNRLVQFFQKNLLLKVISFLVAVALWAFVTIGRPDAEVNRKVSVILMNLPDNMIRTSDAITHLEIALTGQLNTLRTIRDEDLSYEVDLAKFPAGETNFKFLPSRIKGVPNGVNVTSISPTQATISMADRAKRVVPVSITTKGKPSEGYDLAEMVAEPALVEVSGAAQEVERLLFVPTEQVDITGRRASIQKTVGLDLAGQHIELVQTKEVEVKIEIIPRIMTRKFEGIPIDVVGTDLVALANPGELDFNLQGPEVILSKLDPKQVKLEVDASELTPGTYKLRPQINLPDSSVVMRYDLPEVQVTLKKSKKKSIIGKKN